jgi:hypothetical protein
MIRRAGWNVERAVDERRHPQLVLRRLLREDEADARAIARRLPVVV